MSLPSSEPLPNDINDLPPARQRHIRRQPRSASLAERQILLDSLVQLTAPTLNFFLFSFLGALTVGLSLFFDDLSILMVGVVLCPFLRSIFSLALLPTTLKLGHGLKSLVSLLIPMILTMIAGTLAGWLQKSGNISQVGIHRFVALYWLDLALLGTSIFLGALVLLRQGQLPRLIGVILSYEILVPLAAAGFGFILGDAQLWPGALYVGLVHLGIGIVLASFTFLMFGFVPKKALGWLLALIPLTLTLALLMVTLYSPGRQAPNVINPTPTITLIKLSSQTPSPKAISSPTHTEATATVTFTRTPSLFPTTTHTPTATPTAEPTSYLAVIDSLMGAVIRESPAFDAPVIDYVNNGDLIEIFGEISPQGSSRWYQVHTKTGETGWLLGSLVNTQTPAPAEN